MSKRIPASQVLHMVLDHELDDDVGILSGDETSDVESDDSEENIINEDEIDSNNDSDVSDFQDDDDDVDDEPVGEMTGPQARVDHQLTAKNGIQWTLDPPPAAKTQSHNIMKQAPGLPKTVTKVSPKSAFDVFLSKNIVEEIIMCTNREGRRVALEKNKTWVNVNKEEFDAFVGLLLLAGKERSWDVNVRELFLSKFSHPRYKATMSVNRFEDIRRMLRFDDKRTRQARLENDHMAAFRYIWELFVANCRAGMIPGPYVTVDEQLVGFRGRCKFIMYMPNKPAKYGIKIFWLCDANSGYAKDGMVYLGRQPGEPVQTDLASNVVKNLCASIYSTGRNLTTDNYFTTHSLAEFLLTKNVTLLGTMKLNRREIPPLLKDTKTRSVHSSQFCFDRNVTMISYIPKRGKNVILLSSMHHDISIDNEHPKLKPEMIKQYNTTKGGVDQMDQLVSNYTCKRQTRRWPLVLFYNLLDIAALNGYLLYIQQHPDFFSNITHRRRLFLDKLVEELTTPMMLSRDQRRLPKSVTLALDLCGIAKQQEETAPPDSKKRKRCYLCDRKHDKKTSLCCVECSAAVCPSHSVVMCNMCHRA